MLKVSDDDLHLVVIAPVAGAFAVPVATAFIGAKLTTGKTLGRKAPVLRMSVLSPIENDADGDGALARTAVHMMCERRTPNISEYVVRRHIEHRKSTGVGAAKQSKILVPM